jgi:GntR family transcriptional regulator
MTDIRDGILSGEWRAGSRLPGELDLARRLRVSVITVRQALADLTREGLVRRERARGTFVTWSGPVKQPINLEIDAANLVRINPEGTSFRVLRIDTETPTVDLARDFSLGPEEKIMKITRVRMAYGRPLAFVNSYVPARVLHKVSRDRLFKHPLTSIIEDQLGHKVAGLKLVVSAKLADRDLSAQLEIPTGSPVLFVERNYLHKKKLVLRTVGFYRSDLFGYEIKLKRSGR